MVNNISLEENLKNNIIEFLREYNMNIKELNSETNKRSQLAKEKYRNDVGDYIRDTEFGIYDLDIVDAQGYLRDDIDDRIFEDAQDEFEVEKYNKILSYYEELSLLASQPDYLDTPKALEFLREVENYNTK